jgi:hypothetical protein
LFLGLDLIARARQVHRHVRANPAWPWGQHDHPVAEVDALVDVVGHDQDGDVPLAPDPQDQVFEILPGLRVHRAERLVHEQRLAGEGAGDGDPLLHAAGELPRVLVPRLGQADRGERGAGRHRAGRPAAYGPAQRQRHVIQDRQPGIERTAVVLQDHGEPVGDAADASTAQHDLPAGRLDQSGDAAQQGGLSARPA